MFQPLMKLFFPLTIFLLLAKFPKTQRSVSKLKHFANLYAQPQVIPCCCIYYSLGVWSVTASRKGEMIQCF